MRIIQRLRMPGLLSFPPDMDFFELQSLNVLIGPNASGKSNFIEVLGLLNEMPLSFADAIRDGGGAAEWLWKGNAQPAPATIEVDTGSDYGGGPPLKYRLSFEAIGPRLNIVEEAIEKQQSRPGSRPYSYYSFQQSRQRIKIRMRTPGGRSSERNLEWDERSLDQSVLEQRKDREFYPELHWLATYFATVQSFREWTFGRYGALRRPQRADLSEHWLDSDCSNLALVLNQIQHKAGPTFDEHLRRFLALLKEVWVG